MNLEILLQGNTIFIHADWFWYVLICLWFLGGIISFGINIYYKLLKKKVDGLLLKRRIKKLKKI